MKKLLPAILALAALTTSAFAAGEDHGGNARQEGQGEVIILSPLKTTITYGIPADTSQLR